jgi:hypothetical protein
MHDNETLMLMLIFPSSYPQFPEEIAFGKDRKKQGVACHHPKLLVLQRKDSMRVIVTSANLVPRQVGIFLYSMNVLVTRIQFAPRQVLHF